MDWVRELAKKVEERKKLYPEIFRKPVPGSDAGYEIITTGKVPSGGYIIEEA